MSEFCVFRRYSLRAGYCVRCGMMLHSTLFYFSIPFLIFFIFFFGVLWGRNCQHQRKNKSLTRAPSVIVSKAKRKGNVNKKTHGSYEVDIAQVSRQGASQGHCQRREEIREQEGEEGGSSERQLVKRCEEAVPLPPRHRRAARDPPLPEGHGTVAAQAAVPALGA